MDKSTPPLPLWVCWVRPSPLPSSPCTVLSFLPPREEAELEHAEGITLIRARELSLTVREAARRAYLELSAQIGTVSAGGGKTLRQALAHSGQASRWWYHPASFKDVERDPLFQWVVALWTVKAGAAMCHASGLRLVGCPAPVGLVLGQAFAVEELAPTRSPGIWTQVMRGLVARTAFLFSMLRVRSAVGPPSAWAFRPSDVLLQGFWDWSLWWDVQAGSLRDRYFQEVPQQLERRAGKSAGWLVWVEPDLEPGKKGRPLSAVLAPLRNCRNVIVLQTYLGWWEIVRAVSDLTPLWTYWSVSRRELLRRACWHDGLDLWPLVSVRLAEGFVGHDIPFGELMAAAVERAVRDMKPQAVGCFLEHFPRTRAVYEGIRRADPKIARWTIQHASYSREKTFLALSPDREFLGEPDGCAVPHPDLVCAMGSYARELFLACGYPDARVVVTGSPRYDHVRRHEGRSRIPAHIDLRIPVRLLLVASQATAYEIDMVDAVISAIGTDNGFTVTLAAHPFNSIHTESEFAPYRDRVSLASDGWKAAAKEADLIMFTYSTVAEEACLLGIPVWQWLPWQLHGSALAEVLPILRLASVRALRQALKAFQADPAPFYPTAAQQALVEERLFYRADGRGAERVADEVHLFLSIFATGGVS